MGIRMCDYGVVRASRPEKNDWLTKGSDKAVVPCSSLISRANSRRAREILFLEFGGNGRRISIRFDSSLGLWKEEVERRV